MTQSGHNVATKLVELAMDHYDLTSTTVTGIPMKVSCRKHYPSKTLSLYSTRTRTHLRSGLALVSNPHALLSEHFVFPIPTYPNRPNTTPKFTLGPNATLNTSKWNIFRVGHVRVGHVDFVLFVIFSWRWVANTKAVSGGIWALK